MPGRDLLVKAVVNLMILLTPKDRPDFGLKPLLHLATRGDPALLSILECYPEHVPRDGFDAASEISIFTSIACSALCDWTCRALALDILFASISRYHAADRSSLKSEPTVVRSIHALEKMLFPEGNVADQSAVPLVYFNSTLAISGLLLVLRSEEDMITSSEFSSWLQTIQVANDDLSVSRGQPFKWTEATDKLC